MKIPHKISSRRLLPDILVKGADYTVDNIVGAKEVLANGGEVKTITFVEGYSSNFHHQQDQEPGMKILVIRFRNLTWVILFIPRLLFACLKRTATWSRSTFLDQTCVQVYLRQ